MTESIGNSTWTIEEATSNKFSETELTQLTNQFKKVANGNEFVTKVQFQEIFQHLYPHSTPFYCERIFDAFVSEGYTKISSKEKPRVDDLEKRQLMFTQFLKGLYILNKGTVEERTKFAFFMLDLNHTGKIDRNELRLLLTDMYQHNNESQSLISELCQYSDTLVQDLDVNQTGELTLEEFQLSAIKEPDLPSLLSNPENFEE